jgi:PAS domain S-box-containing protein
LIVVNPAFDRMHGWAVEELAGKPIPIVLAPEQQKRVSG